MKRTIAKVVFAPLLMVWVAGCSKSEACTKARLEAADAWKSVSEQSGKLKLSGGPSIDELPKEKQAEHTKQLDVVEAQSDMVFKSFAFEKITWRTAAPAREKANTTWEAYFNKSQYPLFAGSLKSANAQYDVVKATCGGTED